MKNIVFIFLLVTTTSLHAQDTIHYKNPDNFRRVYLEVFHEIPQEELSNKYENAWHVAVWFRNRITDAHFIDYGADLGFIENPRSIRYNNNGTIIPLESDKLNFKIGLRYAYILFGRDRYRGFRTELNGSLGYSCLYYGVSDYDEQLRESFDESGNLNTVFLSGQVKVTWGRVGIIGGYSFTPHRLFSKSVETDFGSKSVHFGLSYAF